jgi:hypothetical protein
MTERQRTETTYADLRPDDQIEDKSGNRWPIADLVSTEPVPWAKNDPGASVKVNFWLCDLVTNIKLHLMNMEPLGKVTVWRLPKHADQVEKLEAEFPGTEITTTEVAIMEIYDKIGATVDLEATAQEIDAAIEAEDTGLPIEILAFEDMTDLEKRSHLYVLHGIYATDLQSRAQLAVTHSEMHAGKVSARSVPHTHLAAS